MSTFSLYLRDVLVGEKNNKEKWKMVLELGGTGNFVKGKRHSNM